MRRWSQVAMLACRGSVSAAQVARGVGRDTRGRVGRHVPTAVCSASGTNQGGGRRDRRPAFGRGLFSPPHPHHRHYHSRWSISVYGKEPGAPRSEYEGYETEIREYKRKGVAFEDAMVNDDLANDSIRTKTKTESGNGDDDDETSRQSLDHLGNIEKQWEGAFGDDDTDDKRDDALLDWGGDNIDLREAEALAKQASGKNKTDSSEDDPPLDPGLYLVGTPIGNLEDITLRALRVMRSADFILCEDTRHTKRLLTRYGIDNKLVSYHAHNQFSKRDSLVDYIRSGAALALVSDAGTPAVSDPGADLATACAEQGLPVIPIPGPCAPAAAIVAAGNLTHGEDSFSFIGFLPPKSGARVKRFGQFANAPGSVVAFVPPHKLVRTLEDAAVALGGERKCVVCREMTKVSYAFSFFFFPKTAHALFSGPSTHPHPRKALIIPLSKLLLPSDIPIVAARRHPER
jgi:16S rRNA (cytidine(1402)-2'-O)-methyltransferase